jgi:hypothetical protein
MIDVCASFASLIFAKLRRLRNLHLSKIYEKSELRKSVKNTQKMNRIRWVKKKSYCDTHCVNEKRKQKEKSRKTYRFCKNYQ